MKSKFEQWWLRVQIPWHVLGVGRQHDRAAVLHRLCKRAYNLGRKHEREHLITLIDKVQKASDPN